MTAYLATGDERFRSDFWDHHTGRLSLSPGAVVIGVGAQPGEVIEPWARESPST